MALGRRYSPSWPAGESGYIGMDFSDVVPPGISLLDGALVIVKNQNPTVPQDDFTQEAVAVEGRQAWCLVTGGALGTDYQCRWTVNTSHSHVFIRTALLLCAETS